MALLTTGTVLELSGINLRDYSARKLTLQMQPIDPGELAYDANGNLHNLTMEQFRKYQFTISCTDQNAPVLDSIWKGQPVTVTIIPGTGLSTDSDDNQQQFDCMLVSWQSSVDEWGAATGWTLTLLEA